MDNSSNYKISDSWKTHQTEETINWQPKLSQTKAISSSKTICQNKQPVSRVRKSHMQLMQERSFTYLFGVPQATLTRFFRKETCHHTCKENMSNFKTKRKEKSWPHTPETLHMLQTDNIVL